MEKTERNNKTKIVLEGLEVVLRILPLIVLQAIPALILYGTSQGEEIFKIIIENFHNLPITIKAINFLVLFGLLIVLIKYSLAKTKKIIQYNLDSYDNYLVTFTRIFIFLSSSTLVFILISLVTHIFISLLIFAVCLFVIIRKENFIPLIKITEKKQTNTVKEYIYTVSIAAALFVLCVDRVNLDTEPVWWVYIIFFGLIILNLFIRFEKHLPSENKSKEPIEHLAKDGMVYKIHRWLVDLDLKLEVLKKGLIRPAVKLFLFIIIFFLANKGLIYLSSLSPSLHALILGFGFGYFVLMELYVLISTSRISWIVIILAWVLIATVVREVRYDGQVPVEIIQSDKVRQNVESNYTKWISQKIDNGLVDESKNTIYIIVSEGGGIRSAFWTAGILNKLDLLFPNLIKKTYAFSGVSGGSVGEMFYCALKKDEIVSGIKHTSKWNNVLGQDYLANSLLGLMSRVPVQQIMWKPFQYLDIGLTLENDWHQKYYNEINTNTLKQSINRLYEDSTQFLIPNIFFNSTHVESGKKAIISNLELGELFSNDIDLIDTIGNQISLKTAGLLSARFPGISPPALIQNRTGENWGKIVDGGYYDNSGLLTAIDIVRLILKTENADSIRIKPVIIFLRNGNTLSAKGEGCSSSILAPVNAFINSWNSKTERTIRDVNFISEELGFEIMQIMLDYKSSGIAEDYPLGWTLSQKSQKSILGKLKVVGTDKSTEIGIRNAVTFDRINELEARNK